MIWFLRVKFQVQIFLRRETSTATQIMPSYIFIMFHGTFLYVHDFYFFCPKVGSRESFMELESYSKHMCDLGIFIHVNLKTTT